MACCSFQKNVRNLMPVSGVFATSIADILKEKNVF